jgi:filamentous hemagglutinin family protein
MKHGHITHTRTTQPSRQVLRRAAIRAWRVQRSMQRAMRRHGLRVALSPLALIAGWLIAGSPAHANPTGGQVVAGSATIENGTAGTLNIFQQSNRAIIDWRSFSIATGETVNFLQPSASSATLNRVLGNDPSAIFGRLNANGTVMLVNPNGIVFGAGSRVDVGGLVASTANIANADFLAGRFNFGVAGSPMASVENHGRISIRDSGLAALVAPRVRNSGVIEARLGRVALGAANTFTLDFHGDGLLSFGAGSAITESPTGNGALVSNSGEIRAEGGTVLLTARAVKGVIDQVINTSGVISATAVSGEGGRIVLSGGDAGTVAIGGTVDASARAAGKGGSVVATGEHVTAASGAHVDASGQHGGGEIALGSTGLTDSANPFANKSQSVTVASGAVLNADAITQGDGGNVTAWSQEQTVFAGSISARGGAEGGNGGFAEVSSQKNIGLTGQVDLRAPKGNTGTLLLDPTDLRITDTAAGGSQNANAADGTVASGDANQGSGSTLNTVSRGLLEGMSGNANIVLQATGQITVDAMASGRVDLATTAGHSFTMQSTLNGGIRFVDSATEIRTQGGAITLEALGIGSSLGNLGRLTTNGGDVTLRATGDIQLGGTINAGSGAVSAQSTVGSISNASGTAPLVTGNAITLTAGGGHIGAAGSAIGTHTTQLALEAGGSIHAGSDMALTNLSVTALHVAPGTNTYGVTGTGLNFQLNEGSTLAATQVTQSGLNLALASDRSLELGTVNLGAGTLSASSTGGNLTGASGNAVTASSVTLAAQGSTGNNGAIGTGSQSINTTTTALSATSGSGGAYVANTGTLNLGTLSTTGASNISSTGTLTAGNVNAGSAALTLGSGAGNVVDDGNSNTRVTAGTLTVNAGGDVGSAGTRLATTATTVNATAGQGVYLGTSATSSTMASITAGNGAIDITTGGSSTLTSLTSSTTAPANSITVATTGSGSMSVGTVNAGAQGDVTLTTSNGSISGNSGLITGETVTVNAGGSASVSVRTAASHLDVQAGSSSITITQTGNVTLDRIATPSTSVSVTNSSGDITVGAVGTSTSGQVSLTASAGGIYDDANGSTRINTGTVTLNATDHVGTVANPLQVSATGLNSTNTGNLYLTNADNTLTSLSITNRHATPGVANVLQVTSPYLTFDVTDNGSQYALNRIVGVPLSTLVFSGDQTLAIGQVQGSGTVALAATTGNLVDDGNAQTRVTSGSTLTLSAAQGSVGSVAAPISVNASSLALTTRGDLYVGSITDLSTLTVSSSHPDTTTSYGMGITAPSLRLDVTDSAAGHNVATLTDASSLALTFTGDRDITLGNVNLTNTGTVRFTSSGGRILDDGNKATTVLGNSTTLSGSSVGASGANHMDVVTGTLAATASAGGVYVEVPLPTGSTNTTSTVTLGTVTATGPVQITALEGDLSLGGFMTATNQSVNLTATSGSILSPSGYSIAIGTGALTLNAGQAIGTSTRAIPVTSSAGSSISAQAGSAMFLSASGSTTLSNLAAGTGITYTQSSGSTTVGTVNATGSGTVALTTTSGSIADDGNTGTVITGSQVSLSAAAGSVGNGAAMNVAAPQLSVTASGNVAVDDSATLTSLGLTRSSGSSGLLAITSGGGQVFNISEDGSAHSLTQATSATPLAFSFSGQRAVNIGDIDVGAAGSATLTSSTSIANSGVGSSIAAGTVSLTAGTSGSIGTSTSAIALEGTTGLTLSAGRNAYVSSDSALANLAITSTNTTTAAGTASVFGLSGLGQTFNITDSGTTQSIDFSGTALGSFSYTTNKNIQVGAITATGEVTLTTSGGGANSNISSDSGSGTIAGNSVRLNATSSTAGGGSIGSSGTALRVDTPSLYLNGSANMVVDDAQNLTRLDMTVTHGTNTIYGYDVSAGNLSSFAVTDGNTQSLGMAVSGAMDFAYSVDRALSLATIDAGTSTTGSIALTSRSAPTGTNAQINRSSGSLTGGSITLSATGSNGGVGAGATLSTNTRNLSIASGGNVSVSNSTTLSSLALDARHNTSGSSTHSYAISSTGLTFSISDTTGNGAFQLNNVAQSSLALSVTADRVLTASSVNTGAGGSVTLRSNSYVQGGSGANAGSPSITTGNLTLNGGSAFGYQGSTPLYTSASTLSSSLSNTLYLSNAGSLTLNTNTVASSADVASSSGSLLQGSGGLFTTPTLRLAATQSLGGGTSLLTDVRRLTLVSRNNIDVSNASDLYALTMTSTHGTPGVQNTLSVAAPELALSLTDSAGGNQYHLSNLVDNTGLDYTLSTDVALNLGTVDAKAGRSLGLYTTGTTTGITNDGGSLLTGNSVTLSATGSVGAAGGSTTRMQTDALGVAVTTGANAYLDNAQDLSSLSLTSTQAPGGTPPVYEFTAPALSFNVTDNGTTNVNSVLDTTGINFSLNTRRDQAIGSIDATASGTVSLTTTGDLLGDASSANRITAGSATLAATNGSAIGSVGSPIRLSAPLVSLAPTGAMNVESDTHIDRLAISTTHPTVTYGGTYSILSVPTSGPQTALFTATDSVTGTALTSLTDTEGLAFSFTSDRAMQVGALNLGTTGTVALVGTGSGSILGDGNASTQVQAASLSMTSYGGAVGATGAGNAIDATVNAVSATAQGGSVNVSLHGRTSLSSISGTGGVNLVNDVGDIALGTINAGGSAVTVDNQGGSILSGSIFNTTTVSLTAAGSIGNQSAVGTSANGGGTTTLTASAAAANGASGSVALSESYNLAASSVVAPGAITLSSGYGLSAGTVTSGGAVSLSSSQGSITGINGSNAITGTGVILSARYGTGNGIGSSGTRLNLDTPQLTVNTPGSVYITDAADLTSLSIDRTNYTGTGSAGTLSVIASNLTLSATDAGNTTTFTNLTDSTGLAFTYLGIGSLAIGTMNVGSNGSATLQGYLSSGDGNITAVNGASLLTAGTATLTAYGTGSSIGSSGTRLGTAVGSLSASSGTGGIHLQQAGSMTLSSLGTTGALNVATSSGDLTLGTLSYGSSSALDLAATAGSILSSGSTLSAGSSAATMTLSAANGIGTGTSPLTVNGSAGQAVNASVTGNGSLYLHSASTLNGGLTTSVNNGSTNVTSAGSIRLTSMTTGTDADGNDIRVTASAGDITVVNVSGGANARHTGVDLTASAGRIVATGATTIEGYDIQLYGANGVGDSTHRVSASGQRVQVESNGGAIYLGAVAPSVLSSVNSNGGLIDISSSADLLLANASSGGGAITVTGSAASVALIAGNINAGSGSVTMSSTQAGGTVQDDGNTATRITGGTVTLNGAGGVGSSTNAVGTSATTLVLTGGASGTGIHVNDGNTSGVTLGSVTANGGAIVIDTAGPTTVTAVSALADVAGNNVTITTSGGDLTVASVSAGANNGTIALNSAGSILASGSGTHLSGHAAQLTAAGDIGAVTDLSTGAGTPIRINVDTLGTLTSTGSNRVVSIDNLNTNLWTLGAGALSLGSGSSAYLRAAGDLTVGASPTVGGNLMLSSAGVLTLPAAGVSAAGSLSVTGSTDVVASGATPRDLQLAGSSVYLRSGAAGGATTLTTTTGAIDAALAHAGALTVNNTGHLASTTLQTSNGDITATSSAGLNAGSVAAGGTGRTVSLTATAGDLTAGTVNASSMGTINLTASNGSLLTSSPVLTASALNLSSSGAIGSSGAAFDATGTTVSAHVTGTGGLYLGSTGALTTAALSTANGDIAVTSAGNLSVNGAVNAGGNAAFASTGGQIVLSNGGVTSSGAQSYSGAVTLGANTTLTGTGVGFTGTVDGNHDLTVNAGSGAASFGGAVGGSTRLGNLAVNSSGATTFGSTVRAATVNTDAAGALAINGGSVDTTGAQSYGEVAVLGMSTTLTGSAITLGNGADGTGGAGRNLTITGASTLAGNINTSGTQAYQGAVTLAGDATLAASGVNFASTVDGNHHLIVNAAGATTFGGTVRTASVTTDAAGTLALNGGAVETTGAQSYGEIAVLGSSTTLTGSMVTLSGGATGTGGGLTVAGASTVGGNVSTSGAQAYNGAVTLAGDALLSGSAVSLTGNVDGNHNLVIHSAGATTFGGTVRTASVTTDAVGTLAINGGAVETTGTQNYGEVAVLGANTTLTGSTVTLSAGANGTGLTIAGASTLGGDVQTSGTQTYSGAVTLAGDTTLHSTGGSLAFGSTLDTTANGNLTLRADAGSIDVTGAVGSSGLLGTLTLRSGTFTTFNGSVLVGSVAQTSAGGLTRFGGNLTASGASGLQFNGASFQFDGEVTASLGAISLVNTDSAGTTTFAEGATVQAATGFTQTGGAGVVLPALLSVASGPISMAAPASLPSGQVTFTTDGDITLTGLQGASTALSLNAGANGVVRIGMNDSDTTHKLNVANLAVPLAQSAELFGTLGGQGGALAASRVNSRYVNAPYFMNGTPWGPVGTIATVTAGTAPESVVPSRPGAQSLFSRSYSIEGTAPNVLEAMLDPPVLTLSPETQQNRKKKPLLEKP